MRKQTYREMCMMDIKHVLLIIAATISTAFLFGGEPKPPKPGYMDRLAQAKAEQAAEDRQLQEELMERERVYREEQQENRKSPRSETRTPYIPPTYKKDKPVMRNVEHDGHIWIWWKDPVGRFDNPDVVNGGMIHHPDCPCHRESRK